MKRLTLTLILTLALTVPAFAFNWSSVVSHVARSTVALQTPSPKTGELETICTAFSINEKAGAYLTANHCLDVGPLYIDGDLTHRVFASNISDLGVLISSHHRVAVAPELRYVAVGSEVGSYGYGMGHPQPFFRAGVVSAIRHLFPEISEYYPVYEGQEYLVIDQTHIGGMSGGPVFDTRGRIVSIVQMGWDEYGIGLGRSINQILRETGAYWENR